MPRLTYASLHVSLIALLGVAALALSVNAGEPDRALHKAQAVSVASDA